MNECLSKELSLFLEKKPPDFQKSFLSVFGTKARDKHDLFFIAKDFGNYMWEKRENGRILKRKEIYLLRGKEPSISCNYNKHHWPPEARGGRITIELPSDFHSFWHEYFLDLYKDEEFYILIGIMFDKTGLIDISFLNEAAKRAKKMARQI